MEAKKILERCAAQAAAGNAPKLATTFQELRLVMGRRSVRNVLRALPSPSNARYGDTLSTWASALISLEQDTLTERLSCAIAGLLAADGKRKLASALLASSDFSADSADTQIGRTIAFVASQQLYIQDHVMAQMRSDPQHSLEHWVLDTIPVDQEPLDVPPVGPVAADEGNHESLELVLRWTLHQRSKLPRGGIDFSKSPYEDLGFECVWRMAAIWRWCERLDAAFRSGNYGLRPIEGTDRHAFQVVPFDDTAHELAAIGRRRHVSFVELHISAQLHAEAADFHDSTRAQCDLSSSVRLPISMVAWDVNVSVDHWRASVSRTSASRAIQLLAQARHYATVLDRIELGPGIGWHQWFATFDALRVLCIAVFDAMTSTDGGSPVEDVRGRGCMHLIVRVSLLSLAQRIAAVLGANDAETRTVLRTMVFDANRKGLDIWSQPLIPTEDADVVLLPLSTLGTANPVHVLETVLKYWSPKLLAFRGTTFEREVAAILRLAPGAVVAGELEIIAADGRVVEFDVIAWWSDQLWLIEAKCSRSVLDHHDYADASQVVFEAVEQLSVRRSYVQSDWAAIRARVPELPASPPKPANIHCIAVTSIMDFTGRVIDNTPVVDHIALRRFFESPAVSKYAVQPGRVEFIEDVLRIWKADVPDHRDLLEYLKNPPAVEAVRQTLSWDCDAVPSLSEADPVLRVPRAVVRRMMDFNAQAAQDHADR